MKSIPNQFELQTKQQKHCSYVTLGQSTEGERNEWCKETQVLNLELDPSNYNESAIYTSSLEKEK